MKLFIPPQFPLPSFPPAKRPFRARLAVWSWLLMAFLAAAGVAGAAPTVTTGSADGILQTAAVLNGTVNPNGAATGFFFQYGPTQDYGTSSQVSPAGNGTADVAERFPIQGLKPATTYHFRAVAVVSANTAASAGTLGSTIPGDDQTFVTLAIPTPTITTGTATSVTANGAVLNGTVNPNGAPVGVRFDYGTSTSYGSTTPTQSVRGGSADVPVTAGLDALAPATTYHFRAVAVTSTVAGAAGVTGDDQTFVTLAIPAPTVTTGTATSVTAKGAVLNGTVNPNGAPVGGRFEYGTSTSYGSATPIQSVGSGSADVPVTAALDGLAPATTYHFRAVGVMSTVAGAGSVPGDDQTFVTAAAALQTVTTGQATSITASGAVLNGTVNPNGTAGGVHFEYGTSSSYGSTTPLVGTGSGTADVPESAPVTGLTPATTYHFRLVAVTSTVAGAAGINGADQTFTTASVAPPTLPTVTTGTALQITQAGAMLTATVNPNGSATVVRFDYGTSATYGSKSTAQSIGAGTADVAVSLPVTGLTASTTYHFRAVAITPAANPAGNTTAQDTATLTYGADQTFTTADPAPGLPIVKPAAPTEVTTTTATFNALVNPNGAATAVRFDYGTESASLLSTPVVSLDAGTTATAVQAHVTGLTAKTTYHFHVVAINSAGTVTGPDQSFTTAPLPVTPPTATTGLATDLTPTSAVVHGTINPNGAPALYRFDYGLDATYGHFVVPQSAGNGTTDVAVQARLAELKPATTYHFRVVALASTSATNGSLVSGGDQTFTTAPLPIGVSTGAATRITTTGATLNGAASPNGNATTVHFEYGTDSTYGTATADQSITGGVGTRAVAVTATLIGLSPHTVYHFRLAATDGTQTRYSTDRTFLTGNSEPKAVSDTAVFTGSGPAIIPVLGNDTDADGDTLTVTTVTQGHGGSVVINSDGTLTYTPGAKFAGVDSFSYRISDGFGGTASAGVTVQSAVYVARGTYNGLVSTASPANENSGLIRLTITAQGAFTGALTFAGSPARALKGAFDANGDYATPTVTTTTATAAVSGGIVPDAAPILALHLDTTAGAQQVTGTVTVGAIVSSLTAPRSPYGPGNLAPSMGKYTLLLPAAASVDGSPTPQGTGFAVMTVTSAGLVTVTGRLGDGATLSAGASVVSTGASVAGDDTFPLYAGLYAAPRGSIFGTVTFRGVEKISDCDGSLLWFKPAQTLTQNGKTVTPAAGTAVTGAAPVGFATTAALVGAVYTAPEKGHRVLDLPDGPGNATLEFDGASLTPSLTRIITITTANTVLPATATAGAAPLTMTITAATGQFTGWFGTASPTSNAISTRTYFQGVVLQKQNLGGGLVSTGDQSGSVTLTPTQSAPPVTAAQ